MNNYTEHSARPAKEIRDDKYGQRFRLICKCGIKTNFHTEQWKAEQALYELHIDHYHA